MMPARARFAVAGLAALAAGAALPGRLGGLCPGCIEGSSPSVASGFAWSILFLAAVPFVLLAVVGGGIFLAQRRELRDEVERFLASLDHEVEPPVGVAGRSGRR